MIPRESSRTRSFASHDLVEMRLRAAAKSARVDTPPALRSRIVRELRDTPLHLEQRSLMERWRSSFTATAALASVMLLLALVASMVRLNSSAPAPHSPSTPAPWAALSEMAAPIGEELRKPVPNPLIREARLIMRDAQNTIAILRSQLPARPRFTETHGAAPQPLQQPNTDGV